MEDVFNRSSVIQGNYFCNVKGIDTDSSYNDTLALFNHKFNSLNEAHLTFTSSLNKVTDTTLKDLAQNELLQNPLPLTASIAHNQIFTEALKLTLDMAQRTPAFEDPTALALLKEDLFLWSKTYISTIDFGNVVIPKCMYYGDLTLQEAYFLILLAFIGFDVIYFNPCGQTLLESIDIDGMSQLILLGTPTPNMISFEERISKGVVIDKVTTYAKQAMNELNDHLYGDCGIYRPWQFAHGTTSPVIMDAVIEDTLTYWAEPATLRPGFKTVGETVYTPVFFNKISGVYKDRMAYYQLVQKLKEAPLITFMENLNFCSTDFTSFSYMQTKAINYHNIGTSTAQFNSRDLASLRPCLNADGTINEETLKTHALFSKWTHLRLETIAFLIGKLNEFMTGRHANLFAFPFGETEKLTLIATSFNMDKEILNLIDRFDFTAQIPKLILYLNGTMPCDTKIALLLGFLHTCGLDIIIFSPNGTSNVNSMISPRFISDIKLEDMVNDFEVKSPPKKGFFNRLFNK